MNNRKLAILGLISTLIGTFILMYFQKDIFMAIMIFALWMWTSLTGAKMEESLTKD